MSCIYLNLYYQCAVMSFSIHFSPETVRLGRTMTHRLNSLNVTFRRLSTGLRVQQASDDAAAVQISNRLEAQLKQAQKEIEGTTQQMSLLQTLDSVLAGSEDRLLRMRDLATKAANGTSSSLDREVLNQELNSIMDELRGVSNTATFNGISLLDADEPLMLALNADEPAKQLLKVNSVNPEKLGRQSSATSLRRGVFLGSLEAGDLTLNGVSIRATTDNDDNLSYSYKAGSAISKAEAINDASTFTGVTAWVEETKITGLETIRELDFTTDHWLKINGYVVSGFQLEEKDASGTLLQHINAGFAESGVVATIDDEGYLTLTASDGRNITIEYSGVEARDAIRIVDVYGDPTNLGDTIDPPVYQHNGDILSVDFETTGSYSDTANIHGTHSFDGVVYNDSSGGHLGQTDYADYYLEIIKPGTFGQATYRIKKENLSLGTIDREPESGLFNAKGIVSSNNSSRITEYHESYYNSASDRQYRIKVLEAGDPNPSTAGSRPLVEVFETNLSDGINNEVSLGTFRVDTNSTINVGNGLILDVNSAIGHYVETPNNNRTYTNPSFQLSAQAQLMADPLGHDYTLNPNIYQWNGSNSTEFEITVVGSGHSIGQNRYGGHAYGYTYDTEPMAQIQITAHDLVTGQITTSPVHYLYKPDVPISYKGLSFRMPMDFLYPTVSTSGPYGYRSTYNNAPIIPDTYWKFTNENTRKYVLTPLSPTVLTHSTPFTFNVDVYDIDPNGTETLIQSSAEEYHRNVWAALGRKTLANGTIDWTEADAGIARFRHSSVYMKSYNEIGNNDGSITFGAHQYDTPADHIGVLEITKAGDGNSLAEYKYYYQDTGEVIVSESDNQQLRLGGAVLPDGIYYNASNFTGGEASLSEDHGAAFTGGLVSSYYTGEKRGGFTLAVNEKSGPSATLSQDGGDSVIYALTSQEFTGYYDGDYTLSMRENDNTIDPTDYLIDVEFSFDDGTQSGLNTIEFAQGVDLDLGYGLKARFNSPISGTETFTGTVSARTFEGNLQWSYADGSHSAQQTVNLGVNQVTNLGNNVKFRVRNLNENMDFTGIVNPRNFDVGDQWTFDIRARALTPADSITITHEARDLVAGAYWKVTAYNPKTWLVDEEIIVSAQHNYETDEQTLTRNISYGDNEMGTVELNGSGSFNTGDRIKIKTRAFMGTIETDPDGYTDPLYPTEYQFTVTKGGTLDEVEISWVRKDGRTETQNDGKGVLPSPLPHGQALVYGEFIDVEEGVELKFSDVLDSNGNSITHFAQGDTFTVRVGEKDEYTFAGQITLRSEDNIDIEYASTDEDNILGRINFLGTKAQANEENSEELSLDKGTLGKSLNYSLATTSLLSDRSVKEAIHTIDLSLKQIGENRSIVGAAMNQVERHALNLSQKALNLAGIKMRLTNADMAEEVAKQAAEQIKMRISPLLIKSSKKNALTILNLVNQQ